MQPKPKLELPEEMKEELRQKIEQVKKGFTVRPPYLWFYTTKKMIERQYPERSPTDIETITAGIWHRLTPEQQIGIMERMIAGVDGLPAYPERITKEELEQVIKEWKAKMGIEKR